MSPIKVIAALVGGSLLSLTGLMAIFHLADHGTPSLLPWATFITGGFIVFAAIEEHEEALANEHRKIMAGLAHGESWDFVDTPH